MKEPLADTGSSPGAFEARGLLSGGDWIAGEGAEFIVRDKFSLAPHARLRAASVAQADAMVAAAEAAFRAGAPDAHTRGAILDRAAELVGARSSAFIETMQAEAGFPAQDALAEVKRCIQTLRLSAEEARRLAGEIVPLEGAPGQAGRLGFTLRVPLGVVLAITPFNAPLNTVAHKIAPAFAAGNATILKPSSNTPLTACLLADSLRDAGIPGGFLSVLHGGGEMLRGVTGDARVRYFAFTGSTEVGRLIQAAAGLRRTQMELGSIAFTLLCEDAELDAALPKVVSASFRKAGQVCTSIQRLLVQRAILPEVMQRLTEMTQALAYGDPRDPATVVGPLISESEAKRIEAWIDEAVAAGATRLAGGPRQGAVVPPTLLSDVAPELRVSNCEIFGPVLCLEPFDTLDDAIARVNSTPYGLATGLFTNRLDAALAAARRLEVGGVHVNETSSARVDMMPYGGSKDSGFGREGPHYAVQEMTEERIVTFRA